MAAETIKPDQFTVTIDKILDEYANELGSKLEEIEKKVGKQTVATLKRTSPRETVDKRTDHYADGWRFNIERQPFKGYTRVVVYNAEQYQLTHLLEYGHDVKRRKGGPVVGHADANPHIAPAQEEAERLALSLIEKEIGS